MAASTMNLVTLVDRHLWMLPSEFKNFVSLFGTELTLPHAECFDTGKGITLPEDLDFDFDEVFNVFLFGLFRH